MTRGHISATVNFQRPSYVVVAHYIYGMNMVKDSYCIFMLNGCRSLLFAKMLREKDGVI